MNPTNKLRFVERQVPAPEHGQNITKGVRVLQQWWQWENVPVVGGEWRDVPLEEDARAGLERRRRD